jgi:hypothetical protein
VLFITTRGIRVAYSYIIVVVVVFEMKREQKAKDMKAGDVNAM